jgi:hypothetical protein
MGIPLYVDGHKMTGDVTHYVALWDAGTEGDEAMGAGANQGPRQSGPDTGPDDPMNYVRQVLSPQIPAAGEMVRVTLRDAGGSAFVLRIENVSGGSTFPSPLAPGVGVVHTAPAPLFINGKPDFGMGLEALAEDGDPAPLAAALATDTGVSSPLSPVAYTVHDSPDPIFTTGGHASSGLERLAEDGNSPALVAVLPGDARVAAVGRGAAGAGPIVPPHGNFSFTITASRGDLLSLATMLGQSNDWFFSMQNQPLFDARGEPISGDFTHVVHLYDAGTEVNEPVGFGANQAPRQPGPNVGPIQGGVVTLVTSLPYAAASRTVHVTITPIYY